MTHTQDPVDLTNCDREPIHKLGRIQPFGALIAVDSDWKVAHVSANFPVLTGAPAMPSIGGALAGLFAPGAMTALRSAVASLIYADHTERLFGIDLLGDGHRFDCAVHRCGPCSVIEIEPHRDGDVNRQIAILRPIMTRLEKHDELVPLAEEAARQLRMTLGMDRVMVYRFHRDLSGEVIAEARADRLDTFRGLRYPKSDIPAQARELYVRNRFRIISDVNCEPVDIVPGTDASGEPIDLSMSTLRAVSPIHIEYLRNMGVEASLSISIVIGGKLWGLFACHHYSPKVLPYSQRTAAELFSELFSLMVERVMAASHEALRERGREIHNRLMKDIAGGTPLTEMLPTLGPLIQQIIPHDGASVFIEERYEARGAAPNEEEFRAIQAALNAAPTSKVTVLDALADRIPRAAAFADRAAGAMIIPVSRTPRDFFILWRRPLTHTVTWAGNPEKPVEFGPNGARLTPRKSFEAWQQSVEGHSAPWNDAEIGIAEGLRATLIEIILRLTDEAVEERAKAHQKQELLIAELNHRVRNILNLIRGLINQSRGEADSIETFAAIVGGRISSLAAAHDNITRSHWAPAPLSQLIDTEAHAYLGGKHDRVVLDGPEAMVTPEAYTVLALVIHEMMTNSAKYGALADSTGSLRIGLSRNADDALVIDWRERGGPPVRPPTRRGFGSTIIERSIPYELGGDARIDYKLSGVEAHFLIPARHVTWKGRAVYKPDRSGDDEGSKAASTTGASVPGNVLVVEDSMIIALDTEDSLRELGVRTIEVRSSVASALEAIEQDQPELAILDYNLGKENSERVAQALAERKVPFWLATGYGEMSERLDELGARGLLVKPYGKDELRKMLGEFTQAA